MTTLTTFANQSGQIPLSELDTNFATPIVIGTTSIALGQSAPTITGLTLAGANLGTPTGNLTNCIFPTLNQNTTGTATNVTGTVAVGNGGTGLTSLTAGYIPYGNGTGALNSSAGLFFDGTNLGIGTSSPSSKLHINITSGDALAIVSTQSTANASVYRMVNGVTNIAEITSGGPAYGSWGGVNSINIIGVQNGPMTFATNSSERMRIDSSGNVLVGTTTQIVGSSKLTVRADTGNFGQIIQCSISGGSAFAINNTGASYLQYFYNNGSVVGSIANSTTTTTYLTSSDKRLKTNIKPAGLATQSILDLPISQFDWLIDDSHQDFGGVAQDILPIIPEMVNVPTDETQMMSVDWSKAVPRLIKTIQELNARLTTLEAA